MISRREFCGTLAALPAALSAAESLRDFAIPAAHLRGFGAVSGHFSGSEKGSLLTVECESAAKADLLHAKYLSDLSLLPGVTRETVRGIAAWRTEENHYLAAAVSGRKVLIGTAADPGGLKEFEAAGLRFTAGTEVPMYLDRWDKYGFLFYYRVGEKPRGARAYSVAPEFAFAKASGTGFVFWANEDANDSAEGMTTDAYWDWAAEQTRAAGLPMHVNTSSSPAAWLLNRYRSESARKEDSYVGSFYTTGATDVGSMGLMSLNSRAMIDADLGTLQQDVRRFASWPNTVGWLEPHGEQFYGMQEFLLERGPAADAGFQGWLRERYSLVALSARWHGSARLYRAWSEIRVPDYASFFGFGPEAIDLEGEWKVGYDFAGQDWFGPGFKDDGWPSLHAPGHDRALFTPRKKAAFRRSFVVAADWKSAHQKVWLYVWDLNRAQGDTVDIWLNGEKILSSPLNDSLPHWAAVEVTGKLATGANVLGLALPKGFLGYKVYLSPERPARYPGFGPQKNAQWADFIDWWTWSKVNTLRRGVQMIRQTDPNRPVNFMHPDEISGAVSQLCREYGGNFHNTGYMAGFWAEFDPLLARGSGLPCSAEPGSGAPDAAGFQRFMGRWLTEGIQGVSYFIHIGDVLWHEDIKAIFEKNLPLYRMLGKYHVPEADVAFLYSDRVLRLTGYPAGSDPNLNPGSGYWEWRTPDALLPLYPRDGVTEEDFLHGNAAKYKVIIDSNSSVMNEALLKGIEAYVRGGGVFVTLGQTGRHSDTEANSWPFSALSGYQVTNIDGEAGPWRKVTAARGQKILGSDPWTKGVKATGLTLKRTAAECQDLLVWDDGSVAAGLRPLGSGFVIHLGARFEDLRAKGVSGTTTAALSQILNWRGARRVAGHADGVLMRHYISNNGLHDVWVLFNEGAQAKTTDLVFDSLPRPAFCTDVLSGEKVTVAKDRIAGLALQATETRMFLSPRAEVAGAPLEWFTLQRNWWQGADGVRGEAFPDTRTLQRHTLPLSDGWLADDETGARPLGLQLAAAAAPRGMVLRKTFTVPREWNEGTIRLYVNAWTGPTFFDRCHVSLDGKLLGILGADGIRGDDCGGVFRPGGTHTLTLEVSGRQELAGVDGNAWLAYRPKPARSVDLSGMWDATADALRTRQQVRLPGTFAGQIASCSVAAPKGAERQNAMLTVKAEGPLLGVITNGKFVQRHHHMNGPWLDLNISPWLRAEGDNRIELVFREPAISKIESVSLDFFDREVYP